MKLPKLEDSIIIHYGCADFKKPDHIIYWIGAISHEPEKEYFFENKTEIETIEKLKDYIEQNRNKTFIHWSMNRTTFGFKAIASRYTKLTNMAIDLSPKNVKDLSEYLKEKYGNNYIEHPRLDNIAELNKFSGFMKKKEVIDAYDGENRLELLFSIVQADIRGTLKTNNKTPQQNTKQIPKPNETLSNQITHPKKVQIAKAIKAKYSSYKGKDFKILYEAFLVLDLFPQKNKRSTFFRCLQNEDYHINSLQILEDRYFNKGYKNKKDQYVPSEDEIQRDKIISYLKTIIYEK